MALLWKDEIDVNILSYFVGHVDFVVKNKGDWAEWFLIRFYGNLMTGCRHFFWTLSEKTGRSGKGMISFWEGK